MKIWGSRRLLRPERSSTAWRCAFSNPTTCMHTHTHTHTRTHTHIHTHTHTHTQLTCYWSRPKRVSQGNTTKLKRICRCPLLTIIHYPNQKNYNMNIYLDYFFFKQMRNMKSICLISYSICKL